MRVSVYILLLLMSGGCLAPASLKPSTTASYNLDANHSIALPAGDSFIAYWANFSAIDQDADGQFDIGLNVSSGNVSFIETSWYLVDGRSVGLVASFTSAGRGGNGSGWSGLSGNAGDHYLIVTVLHANEPSLFEPTVAHIENHMISSSRPVNVIATGDVDLSYYQERFGAFGGFTYSHRVVVGSSTLAPWAAGPSFSVASAHEPRRFTIEFGEVWDSAPYDIALGKFDNSWTVNGRQQSGSSIVADDYNVGPFEPGFTAAESSVSGSAIRAELTGVHSETLFHLTHASVPLDVGGLGLTINPVFEAGGIVHIGAGSDAWCIHRPGSTCDVQAP